jgi:hypothetical protein
MRQWIEFTQAVDELERLEGQLAKMVEAGVADFRQLGKLDQIAAVQDEVDVLADDLAEFYGFGDGQAQPQREQRRPAHEIVQEEWAR